MNDTSGQQNPSLTANDLTQLSALTNALGEHMESVWNAEEQLRKSGPSSFRAYPDLGFIWTQRFGSVESVTWLYLLLRNAAPQSILDPWAGVGSAITTLTQVMGITRAVAVEQDERYFELGKTVTPSSTVEWKLVEDDATPHSQRFDAIICATPHGGRPVTTQLKTPADGNAVQINDSPEHLLVLDLANLLTDSGIAAFLLPRAFFFRRGRSRVFQHLADFGLRLDSVLWVRPSDTRKAPTIPVALAVFSRGIQSEVFVGELAPSAIDQNAALIDASITRPPGNALSIGTYLPVGGLKMPEQLAANRRVGRLVGKASLQALAFTKVFSDVRATRAKEPPGFDVEPNAIYLPNIGRSQAVVSPSEFTLRPHNYFQLIISEDCDIDPRYLASFYSNPLGQAVRESAETGTTIKHLNRTQLRSTDVWIPEPEARRLALDAEGLIRDLMADLRETQQRLWNDPSSSAQIVEHLGTINRREGFAEWLDTLPFPLASVLWGYHAVSREPKTRYERLDHFFEALAVFMATVLLSAYARDEELLSEARVDLETDLSGIRSRPALGNWTSIYAYLAKRTRTLLKSDSESLALAQRLFSTRDDGVLVMLSSPVVVTRLQDATRLRNRWRGHGGIVGEQEAARRLSTLEEHLTAIREVFGRLWERYSLIRPTERMGFTGEMFDVVSLGVMGRSTPFPQISHQSVRPLVTNQLHLLDPNGDDALPLLPFVQIMPSPTTSENACFFYTRRDRGGVTFVSHHHEEQSEVEVKGADPTSEAIGDALRLITPESS